MNLAMEHYVEQLEAWPKSGRHVMAQYDAESVVVYQAYRRSIAEYAVEHGRFGRDFSFSRMSWIKPNFLWMMYRSGWASKEGQEHVLAIRITRQGFDAICRQAVASSFTASRLDDKSQWLAAIETSDVRLQWDPDHDPHGAPVARRAVQLGLRGKALRSFSNDCIIQIADISPFVREQKALLDEKGVSAIVTPREQVYPAEKELGADDATNQN